MKFSKSVVVKGAVFVPTLFHLTRSIRYVVSFLCFGCRFASHILSKECVIAIFIGCHLDVFLQTKNEMTINCKSVYSDLCHNEIEDPFTMFTVENLSTMNFRMKKNVCVRIPLCKSLSILSLGK